MPKRFLILTGTAAVLAVILIGTWIADWGLVTIHVKNAPLRTVIASIARQGHVQVESSLDPLRPITLDVDHATPAEAVDLLATRADATWRGVVIAAPAMAAIDEARASLRAGGNPEGWITWYYPFQAPMPASGDSPIDPRQLEWKPEGPDLDLVKLLDEAAQKSGGMILLPKEWAPPVPKLPKVAPVGKALHSLIASVHGQDASFFYLTEQQRRQPGGAPDSPNDGAMTGGSGADRPSIKPEWADQRARARINKLPAAVRTDALKGYVEMKAVFDAISDLPRAERRKKIQEMMANPALQEQMADARLLRDSKMTAEQRINRAVSYISRKAATKGANN